MASRVEVCAAVLAVVLGMAVSGLTGCSAPSAGSESAATSHPIAAAPDQLCRCPQPVHYSDAEIKAISAALRALPNNNPLQQAMSDYENERDNLRICLGR
jgi:hypothetical protein